MRSAHLRKATKYSKIEIVTQCFRMEMWPQVQVYNRPLADDTGRRIRTVLQRLCTKNGYLRAPTI